MSTAPACQDTAATLQYVQFNASGFADAGEGRTAFVSRALAQPAEVEALLETAREAEMMDELDSVDGKPVAQTYCPNTTSTTCRHTPPRGVREWWMNHGAHRARATARATDSNPISIR